MAIHNVQSMQAISHLIHSVILSHIFHVDPIVIILFHLMAEPITLILIQIDLYNIITI